MLTISFALSGHPSYPISRLPERSSSKLLISRRDLTNNIGPGTYAMFESLLGAGVFNSDGKNIQ